MEQLERSKLDLIEIKKRYKKFSATLDNMFALEDICNDLTNLISDTTEKYKYNLLLKRTSEKLENLDAAKMYFELAEKSLKLMNKYQAIYDDAKQKYIDADNKLKKLT
jgi:hypothetical protein